MKILVADDDPTTLKMLEKIVVTLGYTPTLCKDGREALTALTSPHAPQIAVLDWMMPEMSGIEVCKQLRKSSSLLHTYVILLTARDRTEDVVEGLDAEVNDYATKPIQKEELRARIQLGNKIIQLQEEIKTLRGLLPICAWCKSIRDDKNLWQKVEHYLHSNSDANFTHGICPDCKDKMKKGA